MIRPIVWTIAGSDSGGGAGIQADLRAINSVGGYGCSVITALTAQNSVEVAEIQETNSKMLKAQFACMTKDLNPKVVKLGMLFSKRIMCEVEAWLKNYEGSVVCDPVMVATSGEVLLQESAKSFLIGHILPRSTLLTPNLFEAEAMLGYRVRTPEEIEKAAVDLLSLGSESVVIKGGHGTSEYCHDYWTDGTQSMWLSGKRNPSNNNHGAGCTLSAATAAFIGLGHPLPDALILSKMYVNQGIRLSDQYGAGPGPLEHRSMIFDPQDRPHVSTQFEAEPSFSGLGLSFPLCDEPLGLYPVVDSAEWVERLSVLPGITAIQLRIKDMPEEAAAKIIKTAVEQAKKQGVRLFVNDHWRLAISVGAHGVHLGQEDLGQADLKAIAKAGLQLGISTHSAYEMLHALSMSPSYVAFGPIYHTQSKVLHFAPKGIDDLDLYRKIAGIPVVAIGGINKTNIDEVASVNPSGIAMISGVLSEENPEQAIAQMLSSIKNQATKIEKKGVTS